MSNVAEPRSRRRRERPSFLEQTLAGVTGAIERAVFSEEMARRPGWLQQRDPRVKLLMFLSLILAVSFARSFFTMLALYLVVLMSAGVSRLSFDTFVKRVWLGIPFFAGIVVIPSIFLVPGPRLFDLPLGPLHLAPTIPGLIGAAIFILRVGVSVSLAVLLVLTTPWADVLKALRALRVPQIFVLLLSMTYRYIFLFLRLVGGIFEARKSRTVGKSSGGEQRRWISGTMGSLVSRSFKMSNDVYAAMMARGFTGEIRTYTAYRIRFADVVALLGALIIAVAALIADRMVFG